MDFYLLLNSYWVIKKVVPSDILSYLDRQVPQSRLLRDRWSQGAQYAIINHYLEAQRACPVLTGWLPAVGRVGRGGGLHIAFTVSRIAIFHFGRSV
jgi:hypothetical protein